MSTTDPLVDDLDRELKETLHLQRASDVKTWLTEGERSYLVRPRVRLAHHFDLEPAFLIRDSAFGTLGIVERVLPRVEVVLPGGTRRALDVPEQIRKHVDAATYARHILLRDPLRRQTPALTVELVLLTSDDKKIVDGIGAALRELSRVTDSLFHIGIGLLIHRGEEGLRRGLRRAMPWLLTATRDWLAGAGSRPPATGAATPGVPRVQRVSLSNYRLPGLRELTLAPARVHLVHGPNGSGKSSLVEALELVSCGSVERLEIAQQKDYARVIRNSGSLEAARITLTREDAPPQTWQVVAAGLEPPPAVGVHSSSFRLDQPLMERLVGNFPHERASNYMRAFFPEARDALAAYTVAENGREDALLPVWSGMETLQKAREAIDGIREWRGGGALPTREDFPDLLNRWLERTALVDLAQREHDVRATLEAARAARWTAPHEPAEGVLAVVELPRGVLEHQVRRWSDEAAELQRNLASFDPSSSADRGDEARTHGLRQDQRDALDEIGPWLFGSSGLPPFGGEIVKVLSSGVASTYGTITIGGDGWAIPVLGDIDAVLRACQSLLGEEDPEAWPGKAEWPPYATAAEKHRAFVAAGAKLNAAFRDRLAPAGSDEREFDGSLIAAVNELMALFTPSRWGYDDIRLPSKVGEGKLELTIELGQGEAAVRAELHLNTAELNLFTIALFLLCAGRVDKPLGLLILDDPLQNMDELTTTALARGLGKVVRAWAEAGRREELLLLFHGYEDVERFRSELPAATYRLPWLSPGLSPQEIKIDVERAAPRDAGAQRLEKLVEPRA